MNEFDCTKYDLKKNYMIEASAGTGKTYSITKIASRIKNEDPDGFKKLLLVTFTEKAAGELKDRIEKETGDEGVNVYTFHALCQEWIKEFGLTSNLPLNLDLAPEPMLDDFIDRFMRDEINGDIVGLSNFISDFKPETLKAHLKEALKNYYLDASYNEVPEVVSFDACDLDPLYEDMLTHSKAYMLEKHPEMSAHFDALENSGKYSDMAKEIKESYPFCTFNGKTYKKNQGNPDSVNEAIGYFEGLKKNPINVDFLVRKHLKDIYKAWQEEKAKRKVQTYNDMIRSIREAIVNGGPLVDKLKAKYAYAIIDEFQDTDQLQWDIFKTIFKSDEKHRIIVVGDPKQAIYAFRGSDVYVYKKAKEEFNGPNDEICTLRHNYRTDKPLVDACGEIFKIIWPKPDDESRALFVFEPSEWAKNEENAYYAFPKPVRLAGAWGKEKETIDEYEYAKIVVQQIRNLVNPRTRDEHKFEYSDIMILARTRSEMLPFKAALKKAGIPFTNNKDKGVFSGKECADWIALLDAINEDGYKQKKFAKAFYTNFFGISMGDLLSLDDQGASTSDEINQAMKDLTRWQELASKRKWPSLLKDIAKRMKMNDAMDKTKLQSFGIYRQISAYCLDFLNDNGSLSNLIEDLTLRLKGDSENDDAESDNDIIERSTDEQCVKMMTIHAAKGLEAPIVFSLIGYKGPNPKVDVYKFHESKNNLKLAFGSNDSFEKERSDEFQRLVYVAYTRAKHLLYLPYYEKFGIDCETVREKRYTFLRPAMETIKAMGFVEKISDDRSEISPSLGDGQDSETSASGVTYKENAKNLSSLYDKVEGSSFSKYSYSKLSHRQDVKTDDETDPEYKDAEQDTEEVQDEGLSKFDTKGIVVPCAYDESEDHSKVYERFPRGTEIGQALHEIMEVTSYKDPKDLSGNIKSAFGNYKIPLKGKGGTDFVAQAGQIFDNVIHAELPEIQGSNKTGNKFELSSLEDEDARKEMEFNLAIPAELKGYLNGFIDLVFKRGEFYSIADWKSDSLKEESFPSYCNADSVKKHVDDCYSIQRVLYSYVLVKWLASTYGVDENDAFNKHFGGVYYVFFKGCAKGAGNGIYAKTWESFHELNEAYQEIVKSKVGGE